MCECLQGLVDRGIVDKECVYEDNDFRETGKYLIRHLSDETTLFRINYCPACGEKLEDVK